jgi:hypothetical protein
MGKNRIDALVSCSLSCTMLPCRQENSSSHNGRSSISPVHYIQLLQATEIRVCNGTSYPLYRDDFYFVDRFHDSACYKVINVLLAEWHTNSADESACLIVDNIQNKVVTIHRSQEVLKMLSLYT